MKAVSKPAARLANLRRILKTLASGTLNPKPLNPKPWMRDSSLRKVCHELQVPTPPGPHAP